MGSGEGQRDALAAELAAEQALLTAMIAMREAFDAYEDTFPHGMDPCDPYKEFERDLLWCIELSEHAVKSIEQSITQARIAERREHRVFASERSGGDGE